MTLPDHFPMAPSAAKRWVNCPGSLRVPLPEDDTDTSAADRGTLGHTIAEIRISGRDITEQEERGLEGLGADGAQDLLDAVAVAVDFVEGLRSDGYDVLELERKIQHDLITEHGGTIDVIAYDRKRRRLHVVDFKFGRWAVSSYDNDQIMCYINLARQLYDAEEFYGTIVQPAVSDEPQTAVYDKERLEMYEIAVIEASLSDKFAAGDHCGDSWCPLRNTCAHYGRFLVQACSEFPDVDKLAALEPDQLESKVELLGRMAKIGAMTKDVYEFARQALVRLHNRGVGIADSGFTVRRSKVIHWKGDGLESAKRVAFKEDLTESQYSETKPISAAAMIRLLGVKRDEFAKLYSEEIEFTERPTLVPARGNNMEEFPEFPIIDE